ncbi:MAG: SPOR domain-containing protein [Deltaproteobacteria bacterium]|nr:MAG: SPOR domain-containing protein [Deltaproteobacteria bacterium]TDJ05137.1 MAG: SPOR domain-containing protein [Deltaproteobacteria bacterium]
MSETKSPTNRQIIFLFLGFLILFILVFALGVIVGKGLGDSEIQIAKKLPKNEVTSALDIKEDENEISTGDISQQELQDILNETKTDDPQKTEEPATEESMKFDPTADEKKIAMNAESEVSLKIEIPEILKEEKKSLLSKNTPLPPVVADGQYTIQIGSFKNESDAKKLQNKLKTKGYPAFLKQVTIGEDTWFRLRIGTFETKDQAKIYGDILLKREPKLIKSVYAALNV